MASMAKTCRNCLWWWQGLKGEAGHVCYHNTSPRFHELVGPGAKCPEHEKRIGMKGLMETQEEKRRPRTTDRRYVRAWREDQA